MNLDERTLHLIAVGASVSANCQPCLQISVARAIQAGLPEQEIAEAIRMGKMVRQGAASKMDRFAADLASASPILENSGGSGCGCES